MSDEGVGQARNDSQTAERLIRVLVVVNKALPPDDYRLAHAARSGIAQVAFVMPAGGSLPNVTEWFRIPFREGLGLVDIRHFWQLFRLLRQRRTEIDVAHFYATALVLVGPLVARLAGVRSVVTVTGYGRLFNSNGWRYRAARPLYVALLWASARLSKAVLFQNWGDLTWFRRRLPRLAAKARYVGSAVSAPLLHGKDYQREPLTIVHVARLLPSKGIAEYLAIAESLAGPEFEFRLIGPPVRGQAEMLGRVRRAQEMGIVTYTGELPPPDVRAELERAHVLLFTSHGEGMSRVMLEAALTATCPVAFDIPANRDLLDASRGFLLPRGDVAGARRAIRMLGGDRDRLAAMALAYQAHVRSEYSPEALVSRLDAVYGTIGPADGNAAR